MRKLTVSHARPHDLSSQARICTLQCRRIWLLNCACLQLYKPEKTPESAAKLPYADGKKCPICEAAVRQDDDKYPLADNDAVIATNNALYARLSKKAAEVTTIEDVVYELNTQVKQFRLKIDIVLQDLRAAESGRDDNKIALDES